MPNLSEAIRTIRWMVRDTFRQSISTKLFWVMLSITVVCTAFAASIKVTGGVSTYEGVAYTMPQSEVDKLGGVEKVTADGVQVKNGEISLGFGAIKSKIAKSKEDSVKFIQIWLAGVVGDSLGILLAIIWTAGFLPTFLEPQSATVLLAKGSPRWSILLGKYFGVVGFVSLQALLFVLGTWLALGGATGVWDLTYWLAVPLMMANFAIFYAVSVFIAVATRSTVAAAFGTLLFWVLCWVMNYTHHSIVSQPVSSLGSGAGSLLEIGYWFLPKPLDLGGLFFDSMGAAGFYGQMPEMADLKNANKFHPEASVLASGAFAVVTLGAACYEFQQTDY